MSQCLSSINSMLSGVHSLDYTHTHTHIPSHTKTHSYSQTYTHTDPPHPPPGWLGPFVCAVQRLSQLRWCHCHLSHGSKPLSCRTTTKKSLCCIEPKCKGKNEWCFRSFLFFGLWLFYADVPLSPRVFFFFVHQDGLLFLISLSFLPSLTLSLLNLFFCIHRSFFSRKK